MSPPGGGRCGGVPQPLLRSFRQNADAETPPAGGRRWERRRPGARVPGRQDEGAALRAEEEDEEGGEQEAARRQDEGAALRDEDGVQRGQEYGQHEHG